MIFDRLRVFVSSGMAELAAERRAIQDALSELKVDVWLFEEDAGARPQSAEKTFHQELERADLFIGIFWKKLGQYTRDEFAHARGTKKACLVYEKRINIAGERTSELQAFLDDVGHVTSGLTVKYFETADELRTLVQEDVARWQAEEIRRRKTYQIHPPEAATDRQDIQALSALRKKVRRFWVEGVLEQSLHNVMLELAKQTRPDAVANPWTQILELPDQTQRTLPAAQPLKGLLEEVGSSLLILGDPGSGKTVTLLQLLRQLLDCTKWDQSAAVPVVFNLSTWSATDTTLDSWLVRELSTKYQIPSRIGRVWLGEQRLLLLLDGLDEVAGAERAHCAKAIDEFVAKVGVPGIVVCCRLREYMALPERLGFAGAICLQPLDRTQVLQHIKDAGSAFAGLAETLRRDGKLLELATSPLMFDIMMIAFQDRSVGSQPGASIESLRDHVFEVYAQRMFARGVGRQKFFDNSIVASGLTWLAQEMDRRSQSIFLLEQLQPSALASRWARFAYVISSRLCGGVILGLLLGFVLGAALGVEPDGGLSLAQRLREELALGLIAGSIFGLLLAITDLICLESRGERGKVGSRWSYLGLLVPGLAFSAGVWAALGIIDASDEDFIGPAMYVLGAGAACLIWGRRWPKQGYTHDIRGIESLSWIWRGARIGGAIGFAAGLAIATLMLVSMWPLTDSEFVIIPQIMVTDSLLFGLVGALFGGLRSGIVESRSRPNQGMWLSLRNALASLVGGVMVITIGVMGILVVATTVAWLFYPSALEDARVPQGMSFGVFLLLFAGGLGLAAGVFVGGCASLWYGGVELIHHVVLRFALRLTASIPFGLVRLLEQAVSLVLLRRIGGGYVFIHRLLLEHFAQGGVTVRPDASPAQSQP